MLQCYNRGCGQLFDPAKNYDESCRHHPGEPYFHDAYKGWSCCKKKSVDFTEFLNIKGCTLSKHSNIKPPEPEKPAKDSEIGKQEEIEVRAPIKEALPRPSFETAMKTVKATVAPALKELIDTLQSKGASNSCKENDGQILIGTACKNNGCTTCYTGTNTDNSDCIYHPGRPIFHEGMKFWACCQKRTTDFALFMAQKGCFHGTHKWIKEVDEANFECRHDWHQTAANVVVCIYAKKYDYSKSFIEVNPIRLHISLTFFEPENAKYALNLELRGIVDVDNVKAHMYGTKIEVTLPKLEPGTWPTLESPVTRPTAKLDDIIESISVANEDDDFSLDDLNANVNVQLSELAQSNEKKAA